MPSSHHLLRWRKEDMYGLNARRHYTSIDGILSRIMCPVTTILPYMYLYVVRLCSAGSKPDDLTVLSNPTSEEVLDDLTSQYGLLHNAFNMLRANSAIPDTLASQRVVAE